MFFSRPALGIGPLPASTSAGLGPSPFLGTGLFPKLLAGFENQSGRISVVPGLHPDMAPIAFMAVGNPFLPPTPQQEGDMHAKS